jgi:tetratricopeptide (TPR) repeat protein
MDTAEPAWQEPFKRGMQLGSENDFEGAVAAFREAVARSPEEPYPRYELGYTLSLMKRHGEALQELRRANELSPGFLLVQTEILICEKLDAGAYRDDLAEALRMLQGLVESRAAPDESAIGFARSVVEAEPECGLANYYLGKLLMADSPDEAEAWLKGCVELGADDTTLIDAWAHLGLLARRAGDEDEAKRIWSGLAERYEGNPHLRLTKMLLTTQPDVED